MAIAAQDLLREVISTLQNENLRRWKLSELCRAFNACQRDIVTLRPDAGSTIVSLALSPGAKQVVGEPNSRLLRVIRNTGGNKRSITLVDRRLLDVEEPEWPNATGVTEILHYTFDEIDPRTFYVYPPAAASGASVEAEVARFPNAITVVADGAVITDVTGSLGLPDMYGTAAYDYVCARAFEKDAEYRVNAERASTHQAKFLQALGVEQAATKASSPRRSATESGTRPARAADS